MSEWQEMRPLKRGGLKMGGMSGFWLGGGRGGCWYVVGPFLEGLGWGGGGCCDNLGKMRDRALCLLFWLEGTASGMCL